MEVELKKILELEEFVNYKIIAGKNGINRKVEFLTIMDNPDIISWIKEKEILFSNGYFCQNLSIEEYLDFMKGLIEGNTSGLFIKLKYIKELPKEVIKLADENSYPIIEVPNEKSWTDLWIPITDFLKENDLQIYSEIMTLREKLLSTLLNSGSLEDLCELIKDSTKKEVGISDENFKKIATSKHFNESIFIDKNLHTKLIHRHTLPIQRVVKCDHYSLKVKDSTYYILPIKFNDKVLGFVIYETDIYNEIKEVDILKAEPLETFSAVEITKIIERKKIEKIYYTEYISYLISDNDKDYGEISNRSKELGRQIYPNYIVCVIEDKNKYKIEDVYYQVKYEFSNVAIIRDILYTNIKEGMLFIIPVSDENIILEKLIEFLSRFGIVGLSDKHSIVDLYQGYKESIFSNSCKDILSKRIIVFKELGFFKLFINENYFLDNDFIEEYYNEFIEPVIKYDLDNNTELTRTLILYIENNLNIRCTAKKMYIHENTLRFRINRIEKILNINLKKIHDIFKVVLGSYIYKFKEDYNNK